MHSGLSGLISKGKISVGLTFLVGLKSVYLYCAFYALINLLLKENQFLRFSEGAVVSVSLSFSVSLLIKKD